MKLLYTITSSIILAVSATTASAECCHKTKAACTKCDDGTCDKEKCKTDCGECDSEAMAMTKYAVTGMTCKMCSGKITKALENIQGVTVKKVCHKSGTVAVNIDEELTNGAAVQEAIIANGFKVSGEMLNIPVSGMTCDKCSDKVMTVVKALDGVSSCSVCHKSGHANITVDTSKTSKEKVMEAINATGFTTAAK